MHKKRNQMPTTWPLPKKIGKRTYLAVLSHAGSEAISLLFILRDILKVAKTRKEARVIVLSGDVRVNGKVRKDENFPVQVFDKVSFEKAKKFYTLEIVNRKFKLTEISEKDSEKKTVKIVGKRILPKGKMQVNLKDGRNFITTEKFSIGDSALINLKEEKIEKILPLKEGSTVEIILGRHAGKTGKIIGIVELTRGRDYIIKLKEGLEVTLPLKTLLVVN